jgi:hypothetical protein
MLSKYRYVPEALQVPVSTETFQVLVRTKGSAITDTYQRLSKYRYLTGLKTYTQSEKESAEYMNYNCI